MASKTLIQLTTDTPSSSDLLYFVKNPGGTPLDRAVTLTVLKAAVAPSLTSTYVGVGDGSNLVSGSSALTSPSAGALTATGKITGLGLNTADANDNTYFGATALDSLTTGLRNVAVGENSLTANTDTHDSTGVGYNTLLLNTARRNTAVGSQAMIGTSSSSAEENVTVGYIATAGQGDGNTSIGAFAGSGLSSGRLNVIVGHGAGGILESGSRNILIGDGASPASLSANDQIVIGSSSAASYFINGNISEIAVAPTVRGNGGYKSSDGTAGASGTVTLLGLTSMTFKNGLYVSSV